MVSERERDGVWGREGGEGLEKRSLVCSSHMGMGGEPSTQREKDTETKKGRGTLTGRFVLDAIRNGPDAVLEAGLRRAQAGV